MRTLHARSGAIFVGVALLAGAAFSEDGNNTAYTQHNLVSDLPGLADHTDSNLVNPWGIVHPPAGPWWVNTNGTGLSILYDGNGAAFPATNPLVVTVPGPAPGTTSAPTGIVFNGTTDFPLAAGAPARFLFVTEDGTISGWNPSVDPTHAILKVNHSPAAVYKGAAMGQMNGQNILYVANFRGGGVEAYDGNFAPVALSPGAFQDAQVPAGFAPFNVQNLGGNLFVTYAKQDDAKHDDVAGPGLGYIDEFTPGGALVMRLEHGPWLNSPWAVVMAPAGFGKLSGRLLAGNFGSGQIASYDPASGEFEDLMRGRRGKPITIDGLWGLGFGNNATAGPATTLFFAAGIQDEAHGLFGALTPVPQGQGQDH